MMDSGSLFSGLAGAGISAATGNYIGAGISLIGGLMGAFDSSSAAKQSAAISANINALENKVNDQHEQAMLLSSQRQNIQTLRQVQQAQALGLVRSVGQNSTSGATTSSGYLGGQSQIAGQGYFNLQGVNQNTEIGENIFGLNRQVSAQKLALQNVQTNYQSSMALDQGVSSLGNFVSKSSDPLSRLIQQMNPGSSLGTQ